jgi:hypothetical protein
VYDRTDTNRDLGRGIQANVICPDHDHHHFRLSAAHLLDQSHHGWI